MTRAYASDYPVGVGRIGPGIVVLPTALPDGMLQSFQTWNQATTGKPVPVGRQRLPRLRAAADHYPDEYTVVFDSGLLTVPALTDPAVSEVATFGGGEPGRPGGRRAGVLRAGHPRRYGAGSDILSYPGDPASRSRIRRSRSAAPSSRSYPQARTYSFGAQVLDLSGQNTVIVGGMKKFVNELPGLGAGAANNLGQYIPVAVPDTTTYPGSDYYEIELVEYTEQMHSDLPPTTLRGYRQAGGPANYLGPAIVAPKDRPVRIMFRNLLPTGAGGDLFIPVDSTVMGSGMTAAGHEWMMANPDLVDPQNPMCSGPGQGRDGAQGLCFADNRATLHLHGGITPWISDGTPHQWITPAGENTPYPQGVSVQPVPDMGDSGNATTAR